MAAASLCVPGPVASHAVESGQQHQREPEPERPAGQELEDQTSHTHDQAPGDEVGMGDQDRVVSSASTTVSQLPAGGYAAAVMRLRWVLTGPEAVTLVIG
jgi:hypothetical protein